MDWSRRKERPAGSKVYTALEEKSVWVTKTDRISHSVTAQRKSRCYYG
jgi:hypothetical protein